jgi:hypothetical protein
MTTFIVASTSNWAGLQEKWSNMYVFAMGAIQGQVCDLIAAN